MTWRDNNDVSENTNKSILLEETQDTVTEQARSGGGVVAILASAMAIVFSGISLYQTVIKQANMHLFLPDAIAYTRDPDGSYEVFAIPLTVSNSGARDGILSSAKLEVRNIATGVKQTLEASYIAGADYFTSKEDYANNIRRPKAPFAPLSVPGRGGVTATVLFYARKYDEQRVVPGQGRYELVLSAETKPVQAFGILERLGSSEIEPQRLVYELPQVSRFFEGRVFSGTSERMFRVE
jgi:hypothetical protein